MSIQRFEDMLVWRKAGKMTVEIYQNLASCRDFSFRDQICRAVISVMNNIAEGFERRTNKELVNFLYIARGSAGETRSMLYLALKFGYISKKDFARLHDMSIEISKMLYGLIRKLRIKN